MKKRYGLALLTGATLSLVATTPGVMARPLPTVDGRPVVATVAGEPIYLDSLTTLLGEIAADAQDGEQEAQGPYAVLERLVNIKLLALEGRNIGLDQDANLRAALEVFGKQTLRKTLLEIPAREVKGLDPDESARALRLLEGEARIESVVFDDLESAEAFAAKLEQGTDFAAAAAAAVEGGTGRASEAPAWVAIKDLSPSIASGIAALESPQVVGPIEVETGYSLVRFLEWRVPDDPAVRAEAEAEALGQKRLVAVTRYTTQLKERYLKVDQELLDSLDFDSAEGEPNKRKGDERVLAEVLDGDPVTVGDLASALAMRFFHGASRAAEQGRINRFKDEVFEEVALNRVTLIEARKLGLDKRPEYLAAVQEREDDMVFGLFVQKVIRPELRLEEDELRTYFNAHRDEFVGDERLVLDGIAFSSEEQARKAQERYRQGADFEWLRKNSAGVLAADDSEAKLAELGRPIGRGELPAPIALALSGAGKGDSGVFVMTEASTFLLRVAEVLPRLPLEFAAARNDVAAKVIVEKSDRLVSEWLARLKEAYPVTIHVSPEELGKVLDPLPDPTGTS